jgi:hypothetical protein
MWSIYISLGIAAIIVLSVSYAIIAEKLHELKRHQCKYGNVKAGSSIKVYKK